MDASVTFTEMLQYVMRFSFGLDSVVLYGFIIVLYMVFVANKLPGFVNIILFIVIALPFLADAVIKGAYYSVLIIIGATFIMGLVILWRQG